MTQYNTLKEMLPEHTSLSFAPRSFYYEQFTYKNKKVGGFSYGGIMPTWKDSSFAYRLEGRFINWQDIANKNRVVLLTVYPNEKEKRELEEYVWNDENEPEKTIKMTELTSHVNLLNQQIIFNNETFTVIGLLHSLEAKKDPRFPQDREWSPRVYVPYTTWYDVKPSWQDNFNTNIRIITGNESATRRDILAQFLVEAMLLGLCGSLAGMLLGYLAVLHMAADTSQMTFSWWVVALSVLIALVTSFLFALYPAWQASKLRPVDALKYE